MPAKFSGFPADAFEFFRELTQNNSKEWFDHNRQRYEQNIVGTFRALLEVLTPFVLELNPDFEVVGKTNRNFSRINRDIRFRKDRSPYHTNFYLYFFDRRRDRMDAGRLYLGLSADGVSVGFSIYGNGDTMLERLTKERVRRDDATLARYLSRLARSYESYWYKIEKGDWKEVDRHPKTAEDWDRVKGWVVRKIFSSSAAGSSRFLRQIKKTFVSLYPLYVFTSMEGQGWKQAFRQAIASGSPK